MNEQVENKDKYTVFERVAFSTNGGNCIAADALGKICFALNATDEANEQWVATTINNSIVFERRLWL